ncbi:hypothetical protein NDU88_002957 [Pleurodeles waltl]|uniref:Uncharacterized protein n=1 Tax=Pleurodeles waltl TaxID=8319 RepID=A0AAV7UZ97_PLEWA|nr:hypothetical protein NDU88_002957 [Pleurodeles waltl]
MAPQFLEPASRIPGRPVKSTVRSAFGLFSPPGHEQACKREAAAPGESATGAAAVAPLALRHTRRELASPSPALPAHRGAPATQVMIYGNGYETAHFMQCILEERFAGYIRLEDAPLLSISFDMCSHIALILQKI